MLLSLLYSAFFFTIFGAGDWSTTCARPAQASTEPQPQSLCCVLLCDSTHSYQRNLIKYLLVFKTFKYDPNTSGYNLIYCAISRTTQIMIVVAKQVISHSYNNLVQWTVDRVEKTSLVQKVACAYYYLYGRGCSSTMSLFSEVIKIK